MKEQENNPDTSAGSGLNEVPSDMPNTNTASENHRESQRIQEADRAASPSYELHLGNEPRLKSAETGSGEPDSAMNSVNESEQPHTPSGAPADPDETARFGAEMGGITNLSLEQLKKEKGPADLGEDIDPHREERI